MIEDLWYIAIDFLEKYRTSQKPLDIHELYQNDDETGILERHQKLLQTPFYNKKIDMKILYFELIKMCLEYDKKNFPEAYEESKDLHKIQGFQDLTNRLQRKLNYKYESQLSHVDQKLKFFSSVLFGTTNNEFNHVEFPPVNLLEKLEALEKQNQDLVKALEEIKRCEAKRSSEISALQETVLVTNSSVENLKTLSTTQSNKVLEILQTLNERDEIDSKALLQKDEEISESFKGLESNIENKIKDLSERVKEHQFEFESKLKDLEKKDESLKDSQSQLSLLSSSLEKECQGYRLEIDTLVLNQSSLSENSKTFSKDLDSCVNELEVIKNNMVRSQGVLEDYLSNEPLEKMKDLKHRVETLLPEEISSWTQKMTENYESLEKQAESFAEVMTSQISKVSESASKDLMNLKENLEPRVNDNKNKIEEILRFQGSLSDKLSDSEKQRREELEKEVNITVESIARIDERLLLDQRALESYTQRMETLQSDVVELRVFSESSFSDVESRVKNSTEKLELYLEEGLRKLDEKLSESSQENISFSQFKSLEDSLAETKNLLNTEKTLNTINSESLKHLEPKVENILSHLVPQLKSQFLEFEPEIKDLHGRVKDVHENLSALQRDQGGRLTALEDESKRNQVDLSEKLLGNESALKGASTRIEELENEVQQIVKPKLFGLEEQQILQFEKAHYVEALQDKVNRLDEQKQKSEAFVKETLQETVLANQLAHESLKAALIEKMNELDENDKVHGEKISELFTVNDSLNQIIVQSLKRSEEKGEEIIEALETRIENIGNTASRVESLMTDVYNSELSSHSAQLLELRRENGLLSSNIHVSISKSLEEFRSELLVRLQALEIKWTEEDDKGNQYKELMTKCVENIKNEMTSQMETQNRVRDELRKEVLTQIFELREGLNNVQNNDLNALIEKVKEIESLLSSINSIEKETAFKVEELERNRRESEGKMTIIEKESRDYATFSKDHLRIFRTEYEENKNNYWVLFTKVFGALRGITLILKSDGPALEHQPDCFGVYRMADSFNSRPLYKQDMGENYIYYHSSLSAWMIGTRVGHNHAWMRNFTQNQFTPEELKSGWEYLSTLDRSWESNDKTLRIETLKDIEKIKDAMHEIRISKEID